MTKAASPIPRGFHTITPHLVIRGALEAMAFYQKAFGAEETLRNMGPNDMLLHGEMKIGNAHFMIAEEWPQMQYWVSPQQLQGTTTALSLFVDDADSWFNRAVEAGCQVSLPMMDAFWGDRYGKVRDPFGHEWEISTRMEDLTPEEISANAAQFFAQMEE